jgi:hypothetical protein
MERYLSPAWLDRLEEPIERRAETAGEVPGRPLVLRHIVIGTPDGHDSGFDIVVTGEGPSLHRRSAVPADLTFTTDYVTASGIATGELAANEALAAGRVRVSGDTSIISELAETLSFAEVLPSSLRAETEFG